MNGWMIAGIVISVLALLSLTPLMLVFHSSNTGKTRAWLWIGLLRFRLTDRKSKEEPKQSTPKDETSKSSALQRLMGGSQSLSDLLGLGVRLLKRALRAVRIGKLRLTVTVATDDAARTALWYGRANMAAGMLLPILYEYMRVRNDRVRILPDFTRTEPAYDLNLRVTTSPVALFLLAAYALIAFLKYRRTAETVSSKSAAGG